MDPAKGAKDKENGRISTAGVNGAGSVGDRDSAAGAGGGVNRVVTGTVMGYKFYAGREHVNEVLVEAAQKKSRHTSNAIVVGNLGLAIQ